MSSRKHVGWALMGVGAWSALHGVVWLLMRAGDVSASSFEGAEGMVVTSGLFVALGAWMARARAPSAEA